MKISKIQKLKHGVPNVVGQEVKSVCVSLEPLPGHGSEPLAVFKSALNKWLQEQSGLDFDFLGLSPASKVFLTDTRDSVTGYVAFQEFEVSGKYAFEIQLVLKFYKGLESARIRVIREGNDLSAQISTFMESKEPARALHEVPRVSDDFLVKLLSSEDLRVSIEGRQLDLGAVKVDSENVSKSPLALYQKPGLLPVVCLLRTPRSIEISEKLARDVLGSAHVLLLSESLYKNLKSNGSVDNRFFVYWRDGSKTVASFDLFTELYRFKRQLFNRGIREEVFVSRWRALLSRFTITSNLSKARKNSQSDEGSVDARLVELQVELAIAQDEIKGSKQRLREVEKELNDVYENFDETRLNWQRKIVEAAEIAARLHGQIKSGRITAHDFVIQVDLSEEARIESSLQHLSLITDQAIVFTENAARSWLQARKDGYSKPEVMEKSLENLAKLALDFKLKKARVGANIVSYAKVDFGLEWIPKDDALPFKTFKYEGRTWDQQKHVKADISAISSGMNELGRIHFDIDTDNYRIVVNHIGGKQYKNKK